MSKARRNSKATARKKQKANSGRATKLTKAPLRPTQVLINKSKRINKETENRRSSGA